jgi:hypothetical protein
VGVVRARAGAEAPASLIETAVGLHLTGGVEQLGTMDTDVGRTLDARLNPPSP